VITQNSPPPKLALASPVTAVVRSVWLACGLIATEVFYSCCAGPSVRFGNVGKRRLSMCLFLMYPAACDSSESQVSWLSRYCFLFLYRHVRISAGAATALTDRFVTFLSTSIEAMGYYVKLGHEHFLLHSLQFIIDYYPITRYSLSLAESLSKLQVNIHRYRFCSVW
jgi:hypothetical protein